MRQKTSLCRIIPLLFLLGLCLIQNAVTLFSVQWNSARLFLFLQGFVLAVTVIVALILWIQLHPEEKDFSTMTGRKFAELDSAREKLRVLWQGHAGLISGVALLGLGAALGLLTTFVRLLSALI